MRVAPHLLALLGILATVCPAVAFAEDEPAKEEPAKAEPAKAKPVAIVAPFALRDILPADAARPEGWRAVGTADVIPATAPSVGRLLALAKAAGIEADSFDARCLPLQRGEGDAATGAVAGWLSVDVDVPAFAKALADAAAKDGWVVRPLGSPHRMAVSWGASEEDRDSTVAWQAEVALRKLCDLSFSTMAGAQDRETYQRGMQQLASAQRIDARAGPVLYMQGRVLASSRQAQRAMGAWRLALAEDIKIKMPDRWIVVAAFQVGQALLTAGQEDVLPEALRVLQAGVAAEASSEEHFMRFGNRYNLACTYARLGKKDEAFKHLEESLRYLKTTWERLKKEGSDTSQTDFPMNLEHARTKDTDMEPLRSDERWAPLMAKYAVNAAAPKKEEAAPKKDG